MSNIKNLKFNPDGSKEFKLIRKIPKKLYLRGEIITKATVIKCFKEDYEEIKEIFDTILVTAKLLGYSVAIFRPSYSSKNIEFNFHNDEYYIRFKIKNIGNQISGVNIIKHNINFIDGKRPIIKKFKDQNKPSKERTQKELLSEIFNFL